MTTDKSNLWTAAKLRMRMCYSITGARAGPGLRGCTQDLRAGKRSKPSSRSRPGSRVVRRPAMPVVRVAGGPGRAAAPRRDAVPWPSQFWHGRPACGRPSQDWATENLGSRRRLGGGTSVSEGSDAVGSVKGVHARGGNHSGDLFGAFLVSAAPVRTIVPHAGDPGSFIDLPGPLPR